MRRREFLKRTGATAAAAVLPWPAAAEFPPPADAEVGGDIPPHRALDLEGLHAYAVPWSVPAGGEVSLHVSSSVPYQLSVVRLGLEVDDPTGDEVLQDYPQSPARTQPIHPGSYVHVEKGLNPEAPLEALSLECWLRPFASKTRAGLITQFDSTRACGLGLFLEPDGAIAFYLGDGGTFDARHLHSTPPRAVGPGRWHHIAATWDGKEKVLWVDGVERGRWPVALAARPARTALRLGAAAEGGLADRFLDGDLARPAVWARALAADEIRQRAASKGLIPLVGEKVLAHWPLDEEKGDRIADSGPQDRHGRIINLATWMVGGPAFISDVPRFGDYDPRRDLSRGYALRFASDDLYDCRWQESHRFRVPERARSGFYAARFRFEIDGKPCLYHTTFCVRRPASRERAPVLLLAASNTYLAYNSAPFARNRPGLKQSIGTDGAPNSRGDPPAFSMYRGHRAGQGTYQIGLRMPMPAAGPYVTYGPSETDYSHLLRADRFTQAWLERSGYEYDLVSDFDLHREPDLLLGYKALVINGHSEYWSLPMYEGLKRYLAGGGNVVCLSGNTMFWRVSFNAEGTVMECRKVDAPGNQMEPEKRGECWHSQDGLRGGLLRECGHPGWKLVGLECLGWNNVQPLAFGPYRVEDAAHFLFREPEATGLKTGDAFGERPGGGLPAANGHEFDVRLSTLERWAQAPPPAGTEHPKDPEGINLLASGVNRWAHGGVCFDYFIRTVPPRSDLGAELIFWHRKEGGQVFNAGAIGAGWALSADPRFQTLLRNVLAHFGVRRG
jgi:hypothetical protein